MKNKRISTIQNSKHPLAIELTSGFTLVELIVAIGLFAIVIGIAVGGLVNALRTQKQIASLITADNNVSLVLEQMARELRTGYHICEAEERCDSASGGQRLDFYNALSSPVSYCLFKGAIERATDFDTKVWPTCGDANYTPVTGANVSVSYLNFTISGNLPNDGWPPRVTISVGVSSNDSTLKGGVVNIQTTVSTRDLDS